MSLAVSHSCFAVRWFYDAPMNIVTLSPKFQVVIPQAICKALHLTAGEKLRVMRYADRIKFVLVRKIQKSVAFSVGWRPRLNARKTVCESGRFRMKFYFLPQLWLLNRVLLRGVHQKQRVGKRRFGMTQCGSRLNCRGKPSKPYLPMPRTPGT